MHCQTKSVNREVLHTQERVREKKERDSERESETKERKVRGTER
uniref:Uncharacterized protein n=1 Tax=Anguilla anguilla TaxID=7936 RepID=A0A0E9RD91_ANGAN